nr:immunoglobulin light chain junction region [Macaca mulatta]
CSSDADSNVLF